MVSFLKNTHFLLCDVAEDTHCQTRTREWVATDKRLRDTEFTTDATHFIFEEEAEWFDKFEVHLFRETAYVVVALDDHTGDGERLNHVWINCALSKPLNIFKFLSFLVEDVDEALTDDFTFLFRIGNACEFTIEVVFSVNADYVEAHVAIVGKHCFKLFVTQETIVNEDTSEVATDSLVQEHSSHCRVNAA